MKIIEEFKEFAIRGNAVDLAVGIIIGASFSGIVNSLVEDVIMPPIGLLTGNADFSSQELVLQSATEGTQAVTINYGAFISTIFEFLIVAVSVFLIVKYINLLKRDSQEAPAEEPKPRKCPFCKEAIAAEASRCSHCTAKLS